MGAMGLLSSPAFSRITSYCLQPALGFTAAMLASSANRSPLSMTAAARTHALHLLRYQRPLGFNDKQVRMATGCAPKRSLLQSSGLCRLCHVPSHTGLAVVSK